MQSKIVFGDMLDYYRKQKGWTMDELGKQVGKTKSAVSRWISGENSPKMDEVERLTKLFDTDVETLLFGGDVSKIVSDNKKKQDVWEYEFYDEGIAAGSIEALAKDYGEDDAELIEIADSVMGKYARCDDIFFTRVNGESMNKIIPHQSLIAVKRVSSIVEFSDDDIVLFSFQNGFSIKRFYNDKEDEQLIFSPESNSRGYHDIVVPYEMANELKILGKVILYIVHVE